jgi:molybdenum cofactor guanylyltransferase
MAMVGAVLAGGGSRRMGEPKAGVRLGDRTLLQWAVEAVRAAGLRPVVVAKAGMDLPAVDAEWWDEPDAVRHPLAGVVAALTGSGPAGCIALACDTPFVAPRLLARLAAEQGSAIVRTPDGRLHPFPGRYAATDLTALREALSAEAGVLKTLAALGAEVLEEPDPATLFNVNAPGDLETAAARLRARG